VAQILYQAKRTRWECLPTVSLLATKANRCTVQDVERLHRLVRYLRWTQDLGVVLRPGVLGIVVRLYVDASYGVHTDGKSHTGACVVIGDVGAVHCRSTKQEIVVKSSTEGELVAVSNAANQGLNSRQFLIAQTRHHVPRQPVVYGDAGQRKIRRGTNSSHRYPVLLDQRARG
jgi:hypothetical protein